MRSIFVSSCKQGLVCLTSVKTLHDWRNHSPIFLKEPGNESGNGECKGLPARTSHFACGLRNSTLAFRAHPALNTPAPSSSPDECFPTYDSFLFAQKTKEYESNSLKGFCNPKVYWKRGLVKEARVKTQFSKTSSQKNNNIPRMLSPPILL